MSKLPETLVLFATVHGSIPVESGQERLFAVPQGMRITRVMATRPGVCNVTQEDQITQIVKDMNATFKNITPAEINAIISNIKPVTSDVVKQVESQVKSETPNTPLFQQFLRSHIKTPVVKTFVSGQPIINKFLARSADEGIESAYDYKLNMINVPGNPDLFDYAIFGRTGPSTALRKYAYAGREADLSTMVESLHAQGVNHLVLFDFTCSSFDGVVTDREERALRRNMVQRGVGKTRRRKHKTKTRKAKKRRALWSR